MTFKLRFHVLALKEWRALDSSIREPFKKKLAERLTDEALEHLEAPVQNELTLTQSHPLIRDGEDYADLFTLGAKQSADLPLTSEDCH